MKKNEVAAKFGVPASTLSMIIKTEKRQSKNFKATKETGKKSSKVYFSQCGQMRQKMVYNVETKSSDLQNDASKKS